MKKSYLLPILFASRIWKMCLMVVFSLLADVRAEEPPDCSKLILELQSRIAVLEHLEQACKQKIKNRLAQPQSDPSATNSPSEVDARNLMKAVALPNFKNNAVTGFRLFAIQPESIWHKLNIQDLDVLVQVDDIEIKDSSQLLEGVGRILRKESRRLIVERAGVQMNLEGRLQSD